MIFWIAIAAMTAVVALVLILPLARASKGEAGGGEAMDRAKEQAVYRDQLEELERDRADGLISDEEAGYARAEIARRLIGVSAPGKTPVPIEEGTGRRPLRRRLAEIAVIMLLPAAGVPLYLMVGAPGLPGQPIEERLANPGNNLDLLLAKVERHLLMMPDDVKGWELVAPIYLRNGLYDKALDAYRNLVRRARSTPEHLGNLAEAAIALDGGRVNDEAVAALNEVVSADPGNARARFYLALRLEQDGRRAEAFAAYETIREEAPAGANYLDLVDRHIAATDPKRPAPSAEAAPPGNPGAEDVAAAEGMSVGDRQQMILGMVAALDARLKNEPKNFEGWMRLIRSYGVLGDKQKAGAALKTALSNFPAPTPEGRKLGALGESLGLSAEGGGE